VASIDRKTVTVLSRDIINPGCEDATAVNAGGTLQLGPVCVDGYHFAIVLDPEGNRLA
jgi:hypothetical protein